MCACMQRSLITERKSGRRCRVVMYPAQLLHFLVEQLRQFVAIGRSVLQCVCLHVYISLWLQLMLQDCNYALCTSTVMQFRSCLFLCCTRCTGPQIVTSQLHAVSSNNLQARIYSTLQRDLNDTAFRTIGLSN